MLNFFCCVLFFGEILCCAVLLSLGSLRDNIALCLCVFCISFCLYGATLSVLKIRSVTAQRGVTGGDFFKKHFLLAALLSAAVLCRLIMIASPPTLSDDIYRYVWEGKLTASGVNPYVHAPSDLQLEPLRDQLIYPNINHKHLPAIYPPLSQLLFALTACIGTDVTVMKLAFMFFDLATIAVLLQTLRVLNLPLHRIAIYALNPLVIIEFAGSGHLDSAGIFFLMLALYWYAQSKNHQAAAALSLSFLTKLLPLVFLPVLLKEKRLVSVVLFAGIACAAYVPFLSAGGELIHSLGVYAQSWVFNASLYEILLMLLKDNLQARIIAALLFFGCAAGIYRHFFAASNTKIDPYRVCFMLQGTLLLLSPVVHPWYLCWIIPFLVIRPNRAWIVLSGTVFLSYWVLRQYAETGIWHEQPLVKLGIYVPFFCLMLYDTIRKRLSIKPDGPLLRAQGYPGYHTGVKS